jgi:hypothetical protein
MNAGKSCSILLMGNARMMAVLENTKTTQDNPCTKIKLSKIAQDNKKSGNANKL